MLRRPPAATKQKCIGPDKTSLVVGDGVVRSEKVKHYEDNVGDDDGSGLEQRSNRSATHDSKEHGRIWKIRSSRRSRRK
jgi:hypothetical protein